MAYSANIQKLERQFLPKRYSITTWNALSPYFRELAERNINSEIDLHEWLRDVSELEAIVSEEACWRQIRMTRDTTDSRYKDSFTYFCLEILPRIQSFSDIINRKFINCSFTKDLNQKLFHTYIRNVKKNIDLFRDQNIPILAELNVMQQQYGAVISKMVVEIDNKEHTLQQASKFLESPNRSLRKEVYLKINDRRLLDKDNLDNMYSELISKRHQVALNAGFKNYRDYKFVELGRFDYTKDDCFLFHEAVKLHVLPLVEKIYKKKKESLQLNELYPWDTEAEPANIKPLHPFVTAGELLNKTIMCFNRINPFFSDCLIKMHELGHLDLESRVGKAPGGYNCPLAESGAPFIFMNASGQMSDVTTMIHEGGHAVHSFLTHTLPLTAFKDCPMEIAEVASMSMELFSMKYWDAFFDNEDELKRAKIHQLERVITIFPWIATIDKFQHWIYENPHHSLEERAAKWTEILNEFSPEVINVAGLEHYRKYGWQRQLHLFEVPFYYIEYGIAQLGAIGLWKQFNKDEKTALKNYINALSLGGTKTLPELYSTAGLKFDFSPDHVKTLVEFVEEELQKLQQ